MIVFGDFPPLIAFVPSLLCRPEYCLKAGYDWTYTDLAFCYVVGLRNEPPWPRDLDIACETPNSCTQPLEIDIFNVLLTELEFSIEVCQACALAAVRFVQHLHHC